MIAFFQAPPFFGGFQQMIQKWSVSNGVPKEKKAIKGIPFRLCSSVGICLLWISHQRLPLSLLIYTLAGPSALLPIHQLQWEDSPLRVNFMPIYGQRMWRSPPPPSPLLPPNPPSQSSLLPCWREMESDVATSGDQNVVLMVFFLSTIYHFQLTDD